MKRNQLLQKISELVEADPKHPPVVELDEYFLENAQEDSIAPNQVGYGRPVLVEMYRVLSEIRAKPTVSAVLVSIHNDWVMALDHDETWPDGESVHIFTSSPEAEVNRWIEGLESDGAIAGWDGGAHKMAPTPNPGDRVFSVVWD